jgi:hypothetical protein
VDQYPVQVGRMLFTLVDPHPGYEVAYNRWYERDHFYCGCMVGPWWFAGRRWVSTRALKDLRFPETTEFCEPADAGSFLSVYWVHRDHEDDAFDWAGDQFRWIYTHDRGFHQRTHAHTVNYDVASVVYADDDGIPLELSLDHGFAGLGVVSVVPTAGTTTEQLRAWLEAEAVPGLLSGGQVESVSSWTVWQRPPAPAPAEDASVPSLATAGGSPDRLVQLAFLNESPEALWPRFVDYAAAVDAGGRGTVVFAAPFIPTVVGTDTYTDQLW